jgi:DNA-binding NarL/FixJ family response regulator
MRYKPDLWYLHNPQGARAANGRERSTETLQAPEGTGCDQGRIGVVVADGYPAMRSGLVHELEQQPDMVVLGTATNGDQALELVQTLQPDVLLLDFSMPGLRTMEVVRRVKELKLSTRVVMLTADNDPRLVMEILQTGVYGCLLKDEPLEVISNAVRDVMRGQISLSASVATDVVREKVLGTTEPEQLELTACESRVLRLLAQAKSNREIGKLLGVSERTVRYHLSNIYRKLGLKDRDAALVWAVRYGMDKD